MNLAEIAPDVMQPSQFFDLQRADHQMPEQKLAAEVLYDAIDLATAQPDYKQSPWARKRKSLFADAREWVVDEAVEPFSFTWICHHLGFDADKLRQGVLHSKTHIKICARSGDKR